MTLTTRTVHIFKDSKWTTIPFTNLKVGNIYEMFEDTGEPVLNEDGSAASKVTMGPHVRNDVWTVKDVSV